MNLDVTAIVRGLEAYHFWPILAAVAGFGAFSFAGAFYHLRRARLIEDIPTSKIRSASQGYVELEGVVLPDGELTASPLSKSQCVWFNHKVEKLEVVYVNGRPRQRWKVVNRSVSDRPFILDDDTSTCLVHPKGATVSGAMVRQWRGDSPDGSVTFGSTSGAMTGSESLFNLPGYSEKYRFTETILMAGQHVYALGEFSTEDGKAVLVKPNSKHPFILATEDQSDLSRDYRGAASRRLGTFVFSGFCFIVLLGLRIT